MTTEQKIIKTKVGILDLAKQLGNVSQACADLDRFVEDDNTQRPHHGRWCYGKTPRPVISTRRSAGSASRDPDKRIRTIRVP
jgi:hypothetical protein